MTDNPSQNLTTSAQRLVQVALQKKQELNHPDLCVNHWLLALVERHGAMAESMAVGFDAEAIRKKITDALARNENGIVLSEGVVVARAYELAKQRSRLQAGERDLASVILIASGFALADASAAAQVQTAVNSLPPTDSTSTPNQPTNTTFEEPRPKTPFLDQYGRNLTTSAREGKLSEIIGREDELDLMMETLCRRTKRNPVLIGPAGVGKTAVVEGLALKIVSGKVPNMLKGMEIIALQPSVLIAGAGAFGEMEKRIQGIIKEASQNRILLFIDEIHTIMGAGGAMGTTDLSAQLKPVLARGEIAVIAATTDDEYRKFIAADTALERRFQPIRVNEPSEEQTYRILVTLSGEMSKKYKVNIDDNVLKWLIDFGQQYMRNRHFPDKAVDLLEQSIAHTVAQDQTHCSLAEAKAVAQRMVGMPLALQERFNNLRKAIQNQGGINPDEMQILLNRLKVTMRGLDIRASRPNAILLLSGQAAESCETIAASLAGALYGDKERIITIDLSRLTQPEDITLLVGAPPMYVGYGDRVPLHGLLQTPWCVVRFENVDKCHPSIRTQITQAMREGFINDGRGRPLYFSDAIVLFTASIKLTLHRSLGFHTKEPGIDGSEIYQTVADAIGPELADQVDLFMPGARVPEVSQQWLEETLLGDVAGRFQRQGIQLAWDASLVTWLYEQRNRYLGEQEWERWIDDVLCPEIIQHLPENPDEASITLLAKIEDNKVVIIPNQKET